MPDQMFNGPFSIANFGLRRSNGLEFNDFYRTMLINQWLVLHCSGNEQLKRPYIFTSTG